MAYTSEHLSLAALELLVHFRTNAATNAFLAFPAEVPDELARQIAQVSDLPSNWRSSGPIARLLEIGDGWLAEGSSVALVVPSAVIPHEFNVLLNPRHPEFERVQIGEPEVFRFDERLV
jgi:RES domain-containing protein